MHDNRELCRDCSNFYLDNDSIKLDMTCEHVSISALYKCKLNLEPSRDVSEIGIIHREWCDEKVCAYIRDSIYWPRGEQWRKDEDR